ncbi:MAG: TIM-barrel domain-containing protein [Bacteroidales bacterium]
MRNILPLAIIAFMFASCSQSAWMKTGSGVIVRLNDKTGHNARFIKIEPFSKEIIHVIASPSNNPSRDKSLSVIASPQKGLKYNVLLSGDTVILSTTQIKSEVCLSTGQVIFRDTFGRILLAELAGGGKTFMPMTVGGVSGFTMRQVFDSPDNESFYGLGQHQSDEFNWKGRNEMLYQYNTKVSVPFLISNHNYGILWDNYSFSEFGDPRDYSQLNLFRLYDRDGSEGGLTATYYVNSDTNKVFLSRKESEIDYEDNTTVKNFPKGFQMNGSGIVWSGKIEPVESGLYHFRLYYAGYTKLYIDNELIVPERWRQAWNPTPYKFERKLEKGKRYSVRIEWHPDGDVSYIGLKVLSPLTPEEQGRFSLWSEMGDQIDYYFISGTGFDDIISGYRLLTGKAPIMPKWALGFWQSRERYKSQDQLLDVVKEYRKRNIPLDNIVLDWSYWPVDAWGSHEFDPEFFPDPAGMVKQVHDLHAKIMISVWPKFYMTTEHFREFDSRGWIYRQAIRDSVRDWIGKGYIGSFYDAYNPEARRLFWDQIRETLYTKGIDAWWLDDSEPDILSNSSIAYRKLLTTPTFLGPSAKYFNAYALMNAMAVYDGQRSADPDKRVFLLTRSGFAGLQRYSAATWSGDIAARWEDLRAQIPAGLNYALSGIPYWTFDIGGFAVEKRYVQAEEGSEDMNEWRELYTRWYQFGSFCPIFRSHGQYPFREVYNISPEGTPSYNSMLYYDKLRYYLMPYTYSLAGAAYFSDYTIMRAMVMDFGRDPNVENIGDQFMFGPSLLVAPVYCYKARTREVYFPSACGWYDFYTGRYIRAGQKLEVSAPYEQIPVFVKEGSIIPVGPAIQYTDEVPADPVTLFVYTGRDCVFTLYEDEGINNNYEKGACSTIRFMFDNSTGNLIIGARKGGFDGMLQTRTFRIVWVDENHPVPFNPDAASGTVIKYDGTQVIVQDK